MIYFIDDDESTRSAFDLLLESFGLEFRSFGSAEEFLSTVRLTMTDILVLDLNLPGISGVDLLLKFSQEKIQIPVIIVTAFDDAQSRENCLKYGVTGYLRKPVDGKLLMDFINSATLKLSSFKTKRL